MSYASGFLKSVSLVAVMAGGALADDAPDVRPLEEVVVSATRSEQELFTIPRSITVFTEEAIESQLAFNDDLGQVIGRLTPGLSGGVNGNFNGNGLDQIRGRRLQFLVDGISQSNFAIDFRNDFQTVDPRAIERIEIIRGGTAVYGLGATGGVINIITKAPDSDELQGNIHADYIFQPTDLDDSSSFRISGDLQGGSGPFDFRINGGFRQRNTAFDGSGDIIPSDSNAFNTDQFNFGGTFGLNISDTQRLTFKANYFEIEENDRFLSVGASPVANIPGTAVPAPAGAGNAAAAAAIEAGEVEASPEFQATQNYVLSYRDTDLLGSEFSLSAYYGRIDDDSETLVFGNVPGDPLGVQQVATERYGSRLTIVSPLEQLIGDAGGTATYGFDYEAFTFEQVNNLGLPPLTPDIDTDSYAGFLQVDIPVGPWRWSGGVRYERTDATFPDFEISPIFNPNSTPVGNQVAGGTLNFDRFLFNAGLVYTIDDTTNVYASFAQGFVIGELLRQIRVTPASSVEGAGLEPQVTDNYEIGLRGQVGGLDYTLAAFYSESELGSTFSFNEEIQATEVIRAPERIWGAEATLAYSPSDAWRIDGTFAWQDGEFDPDEDGDFTPLLGNRVQPIRFTAGVDYTGIERLRVRAQALYGLSLSNFPDDATAFGQGNTGDLFLVDLAAFYTLTDAAQLRLGVQNLFDNTFIDQTIQLRNQTSTFFNNPGRTVTLGVDFQF